MSRCRRSLCFYITLFLVPLCAAAQSFTVKQEEKPVPSSVAAAVASHLATRALSLHKDDKPYLDVWWVKETPLNQETLDKPAAALDAIEETTLLGVVTVYEEIRDYRDEPIEPGTYTMRLGILPKDGNHMGVAEYPYFALLIPVEKDTQPEPLPSNKVLAERSGEGTPTSHARVLSLRPVANASDITPQVTVPAEDHRALRFTAAAKTKKNETRTFALELVFEGKGHL